MPYGPGYWANGPDGNTPIDADALTHIENGVVAADGTNPLSAEAIHDAATFEPIGLSAGTLASLVQTSAVGVANGVAGLDAGGKVPATHLPTSSGGTAPGIFYPSAYGYTDGAADSTAAIQACLNAAMAAGGVVELPPGIINVSSIGIDYSGSSWASQPSSGAPYGYCGPVVRGKGSKATVIQQIAGSTGNVFTVSGKTGTSAGPANNNKVVGAVLEKLSINGASSGGHGLYLRSLTQCSFRDLQIRNPGGSGIFFQRSTFVSGVNDEYSYQNEFSQITIIGAGGWGVECDGTNAIAATLNDVQAITCALGGYKICPTNFALIMCTAIGNGVGNTAARGYLFVNSSNTASQTSGLQMIGCRSEGNSTVGGYEIEFQGGLGHSVTQPNILCTQGAHAIGVGISGVTVGGLNIYGGYIGIHTATSGWSGQKAYVFGSNSIRTTLVQRARIDNGSASIALTDIGTDAGTSTLVMVGTAYASA